MRRDPGPRMLQMMHTFWVSRNCPKMTFLLSTSISPLPTATSNKGAGRRFSAGGLVEAEPSWIWSSSLMKLGGELLVRAHCPYGLSNY